MVVWLRTEDGRTRRLVDSWSPSLFVASDSREDLEALTRSVGLREYARSASFVQRYERIGDVQKSEVLEVSIKDARKLVALSRGIERNHAFDSMRIYNADVPPAQTYLYEHDLFPTADCYVYETPRGLEWDVLEDSWDCGYVVPKFGSVSLDVSVRKTGAVVRRSDPVDVVRLESNGEEIIIDSGPESEKILRMVKAVRDLDPDFVMTRDGDTFLLPYLTARAQHNGILDELILGRDQEHLALPDKPGTSFFSYGRIHFKPSSMRLYGRVHIDTRNSFSYGESGMVGLIEQSRVCRQPFHTSSRASIGKALSSLQFYHATKMDVLIPWKPTLAERFKSRAELMVADRGGFTFEPYPGVREDVAELDFSSLYPNIMLKKNISAETVGCTCCPDSLSRVPELGWNVCEKRSGIVPISIEVIVKKRLRYKRLKDEAKARGDKEALLRYEGRQGVLKWLGVTTFGYLGFNNAKFGRIDAHIAVCAWDRKILTEAMRTVERRGFKIVHGIVDSLWLKKDGAVREDYEELAREIERDVGFEISHAGTYKWIAFLNSRVNPRLAVQNRYFGAFEKGGFKIRGIEARRHDTPVAFKRCQEAMLAVMAGADTAEEVRTLFPELVAIFVEHARMMRRQEMPAGELMFTRNLSHDPAEYRTNTLEAGVVERLTREGVTLHAGEGIRYLITDYDSKSRARAIPEGAAVAGTRYDSKRYVEMLAEACATLLQPFDGTATRERLLDIERRTMMSDQLDTEARTRDTQ